MWSISRILERARSPEWMVTIWPLFTSLKKVILKPRQGRMDVKSKRYCSLTSSASEMETSQAMEVEMLDGSSVIISFTEL